MQAITDPASANHIWVSRITGAEVVAGFWRKFREGGLTDEAANQITDDFKHHFLRQYRIVEIGEVLIEHAMSLAQRHGLRGYDSVQLASAIALHGERQAMDELAIVFLTSDETLLTAAQAEGLATDNPNDYV